MFIKKPQLLRTVLIDIYKKTEVYDILKVKHNIRFSEDKLKQGGVAGKMMTINSIGPVVSICLLARRRYIERKTKRKLFRTMKVS